MKLKILHPTFIISNAIFTLIFLLSIPQKTTGENILFYWGFSGYSHRISVWPLIEKLIEKGHNVTYISPYPAKVPDPNSKVNEIVPANLSQSLGLASIDSVKIRFNQGIDGIDDLWDFYSEAGVRGCANVFQNPDIIKWIERSSFDLVVVNALYNDCGFALAYKFKAPYILYSTTSHFLWWSETFGYPHENYPDFQFHYPVNMTFVQSLKTAMSALYWQFKRQWDVIPREEAIVRKALNMPDMPSLYALEQGTSLIFVCNHFTDEFPRSLPPMFVQVGGMHCTDERKPLPKDVLDFINSSGDEGFIFLSFGTYATLSSLPQQTQDIFFNVMKKFKLKFIVKHNGNEFIKFPENVKPVKWISQQDIVAHPKIRALIAHGGLLGTQESIYHGVPMIVFPLFAEQDYNAMIIHARETGISLEISKLTEQQLENAIKEILDNKKYRENTQKLSRVFKDRPAKPLDTAVWWVEYVLRNKDDTSHLRPIGMKRTWYQRRQLDIWGFIALAILTILTLILTITYFIFKCLFTLSNSSKTNYPLKNSDKMINNKKNK